MAVHNRTKKIYIISLFLLIIFLTVSLCTGRYPMTIQEIGHILSGRGTDETAKSVFFTLRLPRTVMAFSKIIKQADGLVVGDELITRFADGEVRSKVLKK